MNRESIDGSKTDDFPMQRDGGPPLPKAENFNHSHESQKGSPGAGSQAKLRLYTTSPTLNPDISSLDIFTPFYTSPDASNPPVSGTHELGDNGYTAVLSADFDLLQLAAPSGSSTGCGLIFARGSFPDSPRSILSRGQRSGFGFGLRIPDAPEYRLTDYLPENASKRQVRVRDDAATGWLNYRWPVTRELLRNGDAQGEEIAEVISTWYIKDGSIIQVSRVARAQGNMIELEGSNSRDIKIGYKFGDWVRLGCCCTACPTPADTGNPPFRLYPHKSDLMMDGQLLTVEDENLGAKMYVQFFQDEKPMKISHQSGEHKGSVDIGFDSFVILKDDPIILIHITSLRGRGASLVWFDRPPSLEDVEKQLEIGPDRMKYGLLWKANNSSHADGILAAKYHGGDTGQQEIHQLKLNLIGRTVEYLLSVAIVPVEIEQGKPQQIAILSDVVSSMRVDVHTLFWQVRTLIRVYNTIESHRKSKALSVICSSYRLRIQQVISGVVSWIYSSFRKAERDTQGTDLTQRWFYVTGTPGIINQSCARAQEQLDYLKNFHDAFLKGYREDPFQQLDEVIHSSGYTHWLLYWSLTLAYTFRNATIPYLSDFIMSQKEPTKRLWRKSRAPARRRNNVAESVLHSFLTWFNALFSVLTSPTTENSEHEQSARDELKDRWDTEKQRRINTSRPLNLYTKVDELNDRMALLIGELRYHPSSGLAKILIKDVQESVLQRQGTIKIKSPRPTDLRITSPYVTIRIKDSRPPVGEVAHWSPWELTCTNYLINLRSHYNTLRGCVKLKEKRIPANRMNVTFDIGCRPFIQRGYSMVASWDETSWCTLSEWWCTETASLFAATLLDELKLHAQDMHRFTDPKSLYTPASHRSEADQGSSSEDSTDSSDNGNQDDGEFENESYPIKFLDDRLFGDEIRIILHDTMMQNMLPKAQEYMFNAMVELERKICWQCMMMQTMEQFPHLLPILDPEKSFQPLAKEKQMGGAAPSPAPIVNGSQIPMSTKVKGAQPSTKQSDVESFFATVAESTGNNRRSLTPENPPTSAQDNTASVSAETEKDVHLNSAVDTLVSEPGDQAVSRDSETMRTQSSEPSLLGRGLNPLESCDSALPEIPSVQQTSTIRAEISCPHKKDTTRRGPSEAAEAGIFPNLCKLLVPHPECKISYRNDSGTALLKWDGKLLKIEASTAVLPSYPNEVGDEYQPYTNQHQDQHDTHTFSPEYIPPNPGGLHGSGEDNLMASNGFNSAMYQVMEPSHIESRYEFEQPSPTVRFNAYDEVLPPNRSPTLTESTSGECRPLPSPSSLSSHNTRSETGLLAVDQRALFSGTSADPVSEARSVDLDADGTKFSLSSQDFLSGHSEDSQQPFPAIPYGSSENSATQDLPLPPAKTLDMDAILRTAISTPLPDFPSRSTFFTNPPSDPDDTLLEQQHPYSLSVNTSIPTASESGLSNIRSESIMSGSDTDTSQGEHLINVNPGSEYRTELPTPFLSLQPEALPPILPSGTEPYVAASPPYPDEGDESGVANPYHNVTSEYKYPSSSAYTLVPADGRHGRFDGYSQHSSDSNSSGRGQRRKTRKNRGESVTSTWQGSRFRDSSPVNTDPDIHPPRRRNSTRSSYDTLPSASDDSDTADYDDDNYQHRILGSPPLNMRSRMRYVSVSNRSGPNSRRLRIESSRSRLVPSYEDYIIPVSAPSELAFTHPARSRSWGDDNKSVIGAFPETRAETIFSEIEYHSLDKDDFKDVFKTTSMIFHPHYMVTSIEDTPALFNLEFKDRVPECEVENVNVFLDATKSQTRVDSESAARNFAYCRMLLKDEVGLTIADFDSQCRLSIYDQSVDLVLARHIFDSRVDTDAKYRIISIDTFTRNLAELHICVLHSEALAALDHYFSGSSRVWIRNGAMGLHTSHSPSWDTFLTLAFHEQQPTEMQLEPNRMSSEFPPRKLAITGYVAANSAMLVESSICFAITGHPNGRTWTCSVMGRRLAGYITNSPRKKYADELRQLITIFGHDGRAARCLIAQTLIGYMFAEVAAAYTELITTLDHVSDKSVIFEGVRLGGAGSAKAGGEMNIDSFGEIFTFNWAIECLRRFEETIEDALAKGEEANRMMDQVINETKSYWSPEMTQIRDEVVKVQYSRRKTLLDNTYKKVMKRVKKLTANRDGISNFLSLRNAIESANQSAAAVEQGNNIKILTLITITYLPLSLATSAFSMGFLPKTFGFQAFVIFLAVALTLTMISVFNLAAMTRVVRKLGKRLRDFAEKPRFSFQTPGDSLSSPAAEGNIPLQQVSQNSNITSQTLSMPSASLSSTEQNHWVYFFFLLRYLLTTLPASEAITTFDLLFSPFHRSRDSLPTGNGTTNVASQTTSAAPISGITHSPIVTNPPPDHTSKWNDLYNKHIEICRACSPAANANAHHQSISHCGVGTNLLKVCLSAREGLDYFSDPLNPMPLHQHSEILPTSQVTHGTNHRSRVPKSRGGVERVSQLFSTVTNRTDTANSKVSNSQSLHPLRLHPQISTQITIHGWITAVARAFLIGFRVVLLPLWIVVLAVDYMAILAGLAALSVVANLRFEGEEDMEQSSWMKRLATWLTRPVWIIGREVSRG
ncbi:hypothetical protein BDD12DRAFT_856706 [Trichophaea hybrida]|nr:hypothetical protein BDD12DRAFT_856706 [Trichophaea hybrida]